MISKRQILLKVNMVLFVGGRRSARSWTVPRRLGEEFAQPKKMILTHVIASTLARGASRARRPILPSMTIPSKSRMSSTSTGSAELQGFYSNVLEEKLSSAPAARTTTGFEPARVLLPTLRYGAITPSRYIRRGNLFHF